jgi:hypothetical protein
MVQRSSIRVGPAAIGALADIAYATNMTSAALITFFNAYGLKHPVVNMLESKRAFAQQAWSALNDTPGLADAISQLLSTHYWPEADVRRTQVQRVRAILLGDGIDLIEQEGRYVIRARPAQMDTTAATRKPSYSMRAGRNPNADGFSLPKIKDVFKGIYSDLSEEGYFQESFGHYCVDAGDVVGTIRSPASDMLVRLRKDGLWPISSQLDNYTEDDFFDVIEYLFGAVSKPLTGNYHSYHNCGMHWDTFDRSSGQNHYRNRINEMLGLYERRFELSEAGEILHSPEAGLEPIIAAKVPTSDDNVRSRVEAAVLSYRRHGASVDDRRNAVRGLADVLEYLQKDVKLYLKGDEPDLFNIANNFGIRHHNQNQKTNYDQALWLSWMFYVYLATIHLVARKIEQAKAF